MSETTLAAQERTTFGKGAARAVRRANLVPAVLYGHGQQPRHLSLPGHELMLALKHGGANALLTLQLSDGEQLALPKAVTRNPIKGFLEHVDLLVVRRGEKVTVDIPLVLTGEVAPGALLTQPLTALSIEAEATHLPAAVELSVADFEPGHTVLAGQVELPGGASLITDPAAVVVSVQAAPTAEQLDAELAASTEDVAGEPSGGDDVVPDAASGEGGPATSPQE